MELQIKLCPGTTCPGLMYQNLHDTNNWAPSVYFQNTKFKKSNKHNVVKKITNDVITQSKNRAVALSVTFVFLRQ